MHTVLLILTSAILVLVLSRLLKSYRIKIYVNSKGKVSQFVAQMKSLTAKYRPTPWLLGCDMHTIFGMRYRKSSKMVPRRQLFVFEDGGTSALDWFEDDKLTEESPILVIIHTLGGGTREPCVNNLAQAAVRHGWRAVVANNRGLSGAPITSARMLDAKRFDDITATITECRTQFKPTKMFLAGFSLGAIQAVEYIIGDGQIDGAAVVSHILDGNISQKRLELPFNYKVYHKFLLSKLTHVLSKNKFVDCPDAVNAKHLIDFDRAFTIKNLGYPTPEEYYDSTSIYEKIPQFRVPTLIMNSEDDPFTEKSALPIDQVLSSDKAVLITTPEGGHVSFIKGLHGEKSLIDEVLIDWFDVIARSQ